MRTAFADNALALDDSTDHCLTGSSGRSQRWSSPMNVVRMGVFPEIHLALCCPELNEWHKSKRQPSETARA
jgi:hypothetical protein